MIGREHQIAAKLAAAPLESCNAGCGRGRNAQYMLATSGDQLAGLATTRLYPKPPCLFVPAAGYGMANNNVRGANGSPQQIKDAKYRLLPYISASSCAGKLAADKVGPHQQAHTCPSLKWGPPSAQLAGWLGDPGWSKGYHQQPIHHPSRRERRTWLSSSAMHSCLLSHSRGYANMRWP